MFCAKTIESALARSVADFILCYVTGTREEKGRACCVVGE